MITLVEDTITDEELHNESPQKLLIINRFTLGVLLSLKVPLHLMIPRFFCYLFSLEIAAMCMFIQFPDNDPGASLSHLTLNIEDIVANASAS